MTAARLQDQLNPGALLITPGDREDLLLATLEAQGKGGNEAKPAGIILTDGLKPQVGLIKMLQERGLPTVAVAGDSYSVAAKIERMTVKTDPGDKEKILMIQEVIAKHLDLSQIIRGSHPAKLVAS
jgi:BioD-like phosphotransacetylase family protein